MTLIRTLRIWDDPGITRLFRYIVNISDENKKVRENCDCHYWRAIDSTNLMLLITYNLEERKTKYYTETWIKYVLRLNFISKVQTLWQVHKVWNNLPPVLTKQLFLLSSVKISGWFFQKNLAFSEKLDFNKRKQINQILVKHKLLMKCPLSWNSITQLVLTHTFWKLLFH